MIKLIPILILTIFLSGCAGIKNSDSIILPEDKVVQIDSTLLTPCDYLDVTQISTFEDALVAYANISTKYGACAIKQASSIKLIKKLGNK